ncbi:MULTISPECIES: glutaredoxin domain-containing protein [Isoptericola]|uniref:glutaredoxin domain-containing protein n=1 Tax=Isoptericola TaxID=254250 RepID=UPI00383AC636
MLTVTVYSTGPQCIRCKMTIDKLEDPAVNVVVVELADNPGARAYVTEDLGYSEAPVVVVEDGTGQDHCAGFRPDQINRVARAAQAE